MNGFSASEAALEGFRLTRERPGTIAAWSVINFVGVTTIGGLMLNTVLKLGFDRPRPAFFAWGTHAVSSSFPSGHAIHAWSVAAVIASEYSDHRSAQVAAYGIATAVSMARFTGEKHFLSDIFVGSVLGFGIGRYVYHAHHRKASVDDSEEEEEVFARSRWPA